MENSSLSKEQKTKKRFIERSAELGPNVMDWIRSVYFSLMGSTLLTLSLKAKGMEWEAILLFALGFSLFSAGLLSSLRVANRFKKYEKAYDALTAEQRGELSDAEYYAKEERGLIDYSLRNNKRYWVSWDHLAIYCIWFPALLAVGYAGFLIESDNLQSSSKNRKNIEVLEGKLGKLEGLLLVQRELERNVDSLEHELSLAKKKVQVDSVDLSKIRLLIKSARKKGCKI